LQEYARQSQNYELEKQAFEIRKRAERKAGELLKWMEKEGKRRKQGGDTTGKKSKITRGNVAQEPKTLNALGITPRQSMDWQKLADVPEQIFEEAIAKATEGQRPEPNVINLAVKQTKSRVVRKAPVAATETAKSRAARREVWELFLVRLVEKQSPVSFLQDDLDPKWKKRLKKDIAAARKWLDKVEEYVV